MITVVQLPQGATQERTIGVLKQIEDYYLQKESKVVDQMITVAGFSFFGRGQNGGIAFVRLKDWKERTGADQTAQALVGRAFGTLSFIKDAIIFLAESAGDLGTRQFVGLRLPPAGPHGAGPRQADGSAQPDARHGGAKSGAPGRAPGGPGRRAAAAHRHRPRKARALGVTVADINATLTIAFGSSYVNDFIYEGRVRRVIVQAEGADRQLPDDLTKLRVHATPAGDMVAFAAFATSQVDHGFAAPGALQRHAGRKLAGQAAPGQVHGRGYRVMEENFAKLPPGFGYECPDKSAEERLAGSQSRSSTRCRW